MIADITIDEKIEQAWARLHTAYVLMSKTPVNHPALAERVEKYKERKAELEALITPKKAYNE